MRALINYFRSCFCKHDFELIFNTYVTGVWDDYSVKTYRCKKCGYARRYKSH